MRKDYIMSEEDKVLKRQKIEENRAKRKTCPSDLKPGFKKMKKDSQHDEDISQDSWIQESDSKDEGRLVNNSFGEYLFIKLVFLSLINS